MFKMAALLERPVIEFNLPYNLGRRKKLKETIKSAFTQLWL